MSRHSSPSAPTFDEYENPDAILSVKAQPPPMYDDVVQEEERFVPDVEKARATKKRGCKSRTKIVLKVGLTLILVTTFVLTAFATFSLVSIKSSYAMYMGMAKDIREIQNDRLQMLSDISRLNGEVDKISDTVYSHHTTTTTTTTPRPPRTRHYYNNNWQWDYYY